MKVEIKKELAERDPLAALAKAATPVLEEAIGPPAARVTAIWGFQSDEYGRPIIQLTIKDSSGQADTKFAPEDLKPAEKARRQFYWLWGELLQKASQRLTQELETVGADEQGS